MKPAPIETGQFDIWLLWSVGRYANGFPMINLRGVYTSEEAANRGAAMVMEWAKGQGHEAPSRGVSMCDSVSIEKRSANHTYGASMIELKHLK